MSVLNTLPAPVVQMGLVEKIIEVEQNQPHVQQLVAQEAARQALQAESERVAQTEVTAQSRKVRDRESGGKRRQAGQEGRGRRDEGAEDENAQQESGPSRNSPWAGHIVNLKI